MISERIYFHHGNVTVTSSRLVLGESSYPLSLIIGARVSTTRRGKRSKAGTLMMIADFLLIVIVLGLHLKTRPDSIDVVVIGLSIAIPVALLGYAIIRGTAATYAAMVTTPAGEQEVLRSFAPDTPQTLVTAIHHAAADRGQILRESGEEE